tara:strand:- start:1068 stop:1241 length:174 start_codon:yes stop_codon:yes gene_type:complete
LNQRPANTKEWEKNSDDWVKTMTQSKENKEEYKKYTETTDNSIPYRDWLSKKRQIPE